MRDHARVENKTDFHGTLSTWHPFRRFNVFKTVLINVILFQEVMDQKGLITETEKFGCIRFWVIANLENQKT